MKHKASIKFDHVVLAQINAISKKGLDAMAAEVDKLSAELVLKNGLPESAIADMGSNIFTLVMWHMQEISNDFMHEAKEENKQFVKQLSINGVKFRRVD